MVSIMLYPCMFCVVMSMDLFVLCVACLTVCELFGETISIMFGCVCYFVVECDGVVSVVGGALLDRPCMVFQRMCVSQLASR